MTNRLVSRTGSDLKLIGPQPPIPAQRSRSSIKRSIEKELFINAPRNCFQALFECCTRPTKTMALDPQNTQGSDRQLVTSIHDISIDRFKGMRD